MKQFQNGWDTREVILRVCHDLFLEKGFDNTTYDDICRCAYVNRGSVYYHFKNKDAIRFMLIQRYWSLYLKDASEYTNNRSVQNIAALLLFWKHYLSDPTIRRFYVDTAKSRVFYPEGNILAQIYHQTFCSIFGFAFDMESVDQLALSSAYSIVIFLWKDSNDNPEKYSAFELCNQGIILVGNACRIPHIAVTTTLEQACPVLSQITIAKAEYAPTIF